MSLVSHRDMAKENCKRQTNSDADAAKQEMVQVGTSYLPRRSHMLFRLC